MAGFEPFIEKKAQVYQANGMVGFCTPIPTLIGMIWPFQHLRRKDLKMIFEYTSIN